MTSNSNEEFYIRLPLEFISLLGALFDCIIKVIKPLYGVLKVANHWFAIYHTYHKNKSQIKELIYDLYLFYSSSSFDIMGMQTDNILILANNNFASTKKDKITFAKIITKNREHFTSAHLLKFNGAQIKLNSNRIVLIKKSHIGEIFSVTNHVADSTSSRRITRKKLSTKEQY